LDRVSTGSGSDLVSDQHATFLMICDSYGLTRSLPLPVLTRSKRGVRARLRSDVYSLAVFMSSALRRSAMWWAAQRTCRSWRSGIA